MESTTDNCTLYSKNQEPSKCNEKSIMHLTILVLSVYCRMNMIILFWPFKQVLTIMLLLIKKYIDQEPSYFMRQICVLQWEEIKTKNSWATHHFFREKNQGVEKEYIAIVFPY